MNKSTKTNTKSAKYIPEVRRAVLARLTIFEVEESELDILAHGSPDSFHLTFAIFLLSVASSFLIALLTIDVTGKTYTVFVLITLVGFVTGIYFFMSWRKRRKSVPDLVDKIRKRLPPEGIQENK